METNVRLEQFKEFLIAPAIHVERPGFPVLAWPNSIYSAICVIYTSLIVRRVVDSLFIQIRYIDGTIRAYLNIYRAKQSVGSFKRETQVFGFESGSFASNVTVDDSPLQWLNTKKFILVVFRQSCVFINHKGVRKTRDLTMGHRRKVTEGIRV